MKMWGISPRGFRRVSGRVVVVKYVHGVLHNKGLLTKKNIFHSLSPDGEEKSFLPFCPPVFFLSELMGAGR